MAKLKKAKIDEGKERHEKKAARAERASSWERKDYGMGSGKSSNKDIAKFLHRAKLNQIKESPKPNLPKAEGKSLKERVQTEPHIIFSPDNPKIKENYKVHHSHQQVLDALSGNGEEVIPAKGKYGSPENSIVVFNPQNPQVIKDLIKDLGQESYVESDGQNHFMHYFNGTPSEKGHGTSFFEKEPEDFYTALPDGTIFSHNFGNVSKSESVDKSIEDEMFYKEYRKKIHQEGKQRRAQIEARKANPSLVDRLKNWAKSKSSPAMVATAASQNNPEKKAEDTPITMTAEEAVKEHKHLVNVLNSPSHKDDLKEAKKQGAELKEYKEELDKSNPPIKSGVSPSQLKQAAQSLSPVKPQVQPAQVITHVAKVPVPEPLQGFMSSGEVVPYDHPHRELAAKFVTDVWRKNKLEGKRMSEKLLGIGEGGSMSVNAKPKYGTMKSEDLDKAKVDEGKSPQQKQADRKSRNIIGGKYIFKPDHPNYTRVAQKGVHMPFGAEKKPSSDRAVYGDKKINEGKKIKAKANIEFNQKNPVDLPKSELEKAAPIPADISAPVIQNPRRTNTGRHYISGPDKMGTAVNAASPAGGPQPKVKDSVKKDALEKAKVDEGKSPEQKASARNERNIRKPQSDKNYFLTDVSKPGSADKPIKGHQSPHVNVSGVHTGSTDKPTGESGAGFYAKMGSGAKPNMSAFHGKSRHTETAKHIHKQIIDQLKKQPKPNLPKTEPMEKAKVDEGLSPEAKALARDKRHSRLASRNIPPKTPNYIIESGRTDIPGKKGDKVKGFAGRLDDVKGVNRSIWRESAMKPGEGGQSAAGLYSRIAGGFLPNDNPYRTQKFHRTLAINSLKEAIAQARSMPKPNLPKSELEKAVKTPKAKAARRDYENNLYFDINEHHPSTNVGTEEAPQWKNWLGDKIKKHKTIAIPKEQYRKMMADWEGNPIGDLLDQHVSEIMGKPAKWKSGDGDSHALTHWYDDPNDEYGGERAFTLEMHPRSAAHAFKIQDEAFDQLENEGAFTEKQPEPPKKTPEQFHKDLFHHFDKQYQQSNNPEDARWALYHKQKLDEVNASPKMSGEKLQHSEKVEKARIDEGLSPRGKANARSQRNMRFGTDASGKDVYQLMPGQKKIGNPGGEYGGKIRGKSPIHGAGVHTNEGEFLTNTKKLTEGQKQRVDEGWDDGYSDFQEENKQWNRQLMAQKLLELFKIKPNLPKSEIETPDMNKKKDLEKANAFEAKSGMGTKAANANPAIAQTKKVIRAANPVKAPQMGVSNPLGSKKMGSVNPAGMSVSGFAVRTGKPSSAKMARENNLSNLKAMPKPNLPKSEPVEKIDPKSHLPGTLLDKSAGKKELAGRLSKCYAAKMEKVDKNKIIRNKNESGINKPYAVGSGGVGISGQGYTVRGGMAAGLHEQSFRHKDSAGPYDKDLAKEKAKSTLKDLKAMPKPNLPKSEDPKMVEAKEVGEPLKKPYSSEAQRRWAHTASGEKALGGKAAVAHWDKESKGKHLPEKVKKDEPAPKKWSALEAAMARAAEKRRLNQPHVEAEAAKKKAAEAELQAQKIQQEEARKPENIQLDRPKYLTIAQHYDSISNARPNPLSEMGKKTPDHLDDLKKLNDYHGRNIIQGVHDQPVKEWGTHTFLLHPDGKLQYVHSFLDTSDSRK